MTRARPWTGALAAAGATLLLAGCGGSGTTTVTVGATTTRAAPVAAAGSDLGGRAPFAANGPWNTQVQSMPTAPDSDRMIRIAAEQPVDAADRTHLQAKASRARLAINLTGWAPGVYAVGAGSPVRLICRQPQCGIVGDAPPSTLRLGSDAVPDPGHDGWLVLVDQSRGVVWDLWRARRAGSAISYAFARKWSLSERGVGPIARTLPKRTPSVRGSGLPLLGGLIRPREVRAGRIPHALAIAIPGPAADVFVPPASTTNGLASRKAVPEGARLRLRASALARLQRASRSTGAGALAVAQALATYGAIVVDRADAPTLYAQRNGAYSGYLKSSSLSRLRLKDFEVLPLGRTYTDTAAPPEAR